MRICVTLREVFDFKPLQKHNLVYAAEPESLLASYTFKNNIIVAFT